MADDGDKAGLAGSALKKLFDSIISPLVFGGLVALGVAKSQKVDDIQNYKAWLLILVLFLLVTFLGEWFRRSFARWRVPVASGKRPAILLARLSGDKGGAPLRETVREAINKELKDRVDLIMWPEELKIGDGSNADSEMRALAKAWGWLGSKQCDLLISGRVKGDKNLSLRFTGAGDSNLAAANYALTADTLELPAQFIEQLGAAIAAKIVGNITPMMTQYGFLVPLMQQKAASLQPLVDNLNPAYAPATRASLLRTYGFVRKTIGEQAGSDSDLRLAAAAYRQALQESPRLDNGPDWASAQDGLGTVLAILGETDSDTGKLTEAVEAYREALKERTRAAAPFEWATTQNNLGAALAAIGEGENGTANLELAVTAYREALTEFKRPRFPLKWAIAQNNLGDALWLLGDRENNSSRLEEAATAYTEALKEFDRDRTSLAWATSHSGLGNVLTSHGRLDNSSERLEQAVNHFQEALQERSLDRVPFHYANTQNGLGQALTSLGDNEGDIARFQSAVLAYRESQKGWPVEKYPVGWARAQTGIGKALALSGRQQKNTALLDQAIKAHRSALAIFKDADVTRETEDAKADLQQAEAFLLELQKK
jgi:tetratricopeptide (TPR) repeat protein